MKRILSIAVAGAAMALAVPAHAALTPVGFACATTDVTSSSGQNADSCVGYYLGNLNGVPVNQVDANVQAALELLDPSFIGNPYSVIAVLGSLDANTGVIDFAGLLSGKTIIGLHRGGAGDFKKDGTAFYLWNNLTSSDTIQYNLKGLSNSTLYATVFSSVPEPATWMLMIAGIGLIGFALRRQKQNVTAKINFA